ncbi:MAG: imidazoleglycerol-phosphate dehydratase HisB [Candidatus Ratteibacteria bacterium]|nr:imidazoleglycerol-phosphate dehydratase HisB [Candidatus Ratteibacteria bacterium]
MERIAKVKRKTKETDISLDIDIDGSGKGDISTGIGFLDHMLTLLAKFSGIDITIRAKGDVDVDTHHTIEDTGICLGDAIKKALGDRKGIKRFGFASVPMDEVLVNTSLDISGRPLLVFNVPYIKGREGSFEAEDTKEFLKGFTTHSSITLHINLAYGDNLHHINEAIFKSLGLALKGAIKTEGTDIPSTKGCLDR